MDNENRQATRGVSGKQGVQDVHDVDVDVNMDGGGATALNAAPDMAAAGTVDTTDTAIRADDDVTAPSGAVGADLIQTLRERRLITLALADQVGEDRWRAAALARDRSLHDLLATLLAWDEWAAAAFEVSLLRALPTKLVAPVQSAEARHDFEARAMARYTPLGRADLLASLQAAGERAISGAIGRGAPGWHARQIAGLTLVQLYPRYPQPPNGQHDAARSEDDAHSAPTVGDILRWLMAREQRRDAAISAGLGVNADIEQLRARFTREAADR